MQLRPLKTDPIASSAFAESKKKFQPILPKRVYFCIKIVLGAKNIDFFLVVKNMIVGWEEMLTNTVGFFFFKNVF